MTLARRCSLVLATIALTAGAARAAEPLAVTFEPDGATVRVGGEVFARYLMRSGTRPVLWPVVGPTGAPMTRSYPVGKLEPDESPDHIHHRSMWIGYEGFNGVDFWHEPELERDRHLPVGSVRHREFVRGDSTGDVATLGARNDWLAPDGRVVCHDQRLMEFRAGDEWRSIDFLVDIWSSDGPLEIGDTKEGLFAMRVPGTMKVEAKRGGKITNSNGDTDADAWGKPAAWVDYTGPVGGETVGIAVFAHPTNRHPTPRWHIRPYGLLAANPLGVVPYSGDPAGGPGGLTLAEGEHLRLRYRVLLHKGVSDAEQLADSFDDYAE